jgi:hypothetical protein
MRHDRHACQQKKKTHASQKKKMLKLKHVSNWVFCSRVNVRVVILLNKKTAKKKAKKRCGKTMKERKAKKKNLR